MAISLRRYIDITSGVGAASSVSRRELIGRLFTNSNLLPTNSYVEMDTLEDVAEFFGSSSEEYLRALFYFGFVSKSISSPNRISFARWADVDTAPMIIGVESNTLLSAFQAISDGAFVLTLGGVDNAMTGIDFSLAASFADVASALQTAIRTGTGTVFTNATVTYDATNSRFVFTGGEVGTASVAISAPATGTDIREALGWTTSARYSNGLDAQTVTEVLESSAAVSNNFGSFLFIPTLTTDQIVDVATWNAGHNVEFMYCVPVTAANAATVSAAVAQIGGTALILSGPSGEYHEMAPMMVMAATDYNRRSSVQNYMFQQFGITPTVTTDADANTYDALRVNYYGQTQSAGQQLSFFQRGVMMGATVSPLDMNTYANEVWLKSEASAALMDLLIASTRISANNEGRGMLIASIQDVIEMGLVNGTISVGNTLNSVQQLYITQITNDINAWRQVATAGYWANVVFREEDGETIAVYTLVYAKDNVVRSVQGTHTLI